MSLDLSGGAIVSRLQQASRLAGSLRAETRLEAKLDMRGPSVAARVRQASELLELCRSLARAGDRAGAGVATLANRSVLEGPAAPIIRPRGPG